MGGASVQPCRDGKPTSSGPSSMQLSGNVPAEEVDVARLFAGGHSPPDGSCRTMLKIKANAPAHTPNHRISVTDIKSAVVRQHGGTKEIAHQRG